MSVQEFVTTDILRLEVEDDPTGLVNLVQNPDGELGGWGWITPVAGSKMGSRPGPYLQYVTALGASYFYTEPMPVSAGQYVAAYWHQMGGTVGVYTRVRFEWLSAAGAVLSSSTQSAYQSTLPVADLFYPATVAPASTAYVRMRFDLYSNTSGANLVSAATFGFKQVTVAKAAASGALQTQRINLVPNPSFEVNTTGWTGSPGTLARVTTQHAVDAASMSVTATGAGAMTAQTALGVSGFPVTPGNYAVQVKAKAATVARDIQVQLVFFDAGGAAIAFTPQGNSGFSDTTTGWTTFTGFLTAPAGAVWGQAKVRINGAAGAGEVHYIDAVIVERTSGTPTYFDGAVASAGAVFYAWTGTAHQSASTETISGLTYIAPVPYLDVLGPTHEIKVTREGFNVGTIAATILDASLDPSQSSKLRPGRRVRLLLFDGVSAWSPMFTGKISNAKVSYDYKTPGVDDGRRARIELTGVDAMAQLANQQRSLGVATITDLPYLLEDAGVPWNVNGSGAQVAVATTVAKNDNASLADKIAITRDTQLGYAWVDRYGTVQVWDNSLISATPASTVDEDDYSDIEIDYDTDRCINEVTVKLLRYNLATGETVEVPYGPYRDETSITQWGVHSADFTVQGLAENGVAIPAYAQAILDANSEPQVRINSVVVPVSSEAVAAKVGAWDLYTLLTVANTDAGLSDGIRTVTIEHAITPDKWLTTLGFEVEDSVAQPTFTPSPPLTAQATTDGTWIPVTYAGAWVNSGGTDQVMRYMRKNGVVYLEGVMKTGTINTTAFTLPAGYRPAGNLQIACIANSAIARLQITAAGVVTPVVGSNVWFAITTSFIAEQ